MTPKPQRKEVDPDAHRRIDVMEEGLRRHEESFTQSNEAFKAAIDKLEEKIEAWFKDAADQFQKLHDRISQGRRFRERMMIGLILTLLSAVAGLLALCGFLFAKILWG